MTDLTVWAIEWTHTRRNSYSQALRSLMRSNHSPGSRMCSLIGMDFHKKHCNNNNCFCPHIALVPSVSVSKPWVTIQTMNVSGNRIQRRAIYTSCVSGNTQGGSLGKSKHLTKFAYSFNRCTECQTCDFIADSPPSPLRHRTERNGTEKSLPFLVHAWPRGMPHKIGPPAVPKLTYTY